MIKIEEVDVYGWEAAIRGMRNPKNSWYKSDTVYVFPLPIIGENDMTLMKSLGKAGPVHGKYLRMITVTCDITCHHVWWAEFDTYKVGTVRNSCSKMHKIHVKSFEKDDFSHEGIDAVSADYPEMMEDFERTMARLEWLRVKFNETQDKRFWRAMIEYLPMGYNIKATVQLNYEVLRGMYEYRKNHKLDEWREFCEWIKTLPYSELITYEEIENE